MNDAPTLELQAVERTYKTAAGGLTVLNGATLSVGRGELVGLVAPSGAGKSTLLHVAGLLERPDGGDVALQGEGCNKLTDRQRTLLRRSRVGFVYQFHHLLPDFNARENVVLPQLVADVPRDASEARADELLTALGLGHRLEHRPSQLSGGEQQRVALARAFACRPKILFADEPTGNLDGATGAEVIDQLFELNAEQGTTLVLVTHDEDLAARCARRTRLADGKLHEH